MRSYVVAGVDGSPSSVAAVQYAADWAARAGLDLHLVHGYLHPIGAAPVLPAIPAPPASGAEMLQRVAAGLATRHPELTIVCRQVAGGGPATMVAESRQADLTVVGSRGLGTLAAVTLGSTATIVCAHAHGPVIVARPPAEIPGPEAPVVVGVDGSDHSIPALDFAFEIAASAGASVVAVHAWWARPLQTLKDLGRYVPEKVEAAAGEVLSGALEPWRQKYPGVGLVETLVHSMNPAEELIDASARAGLVVVGTRGHGGFAGLLLGSVSLSVAQHAHCPVAIVRPHTHGRCDR